jgi:hypothetical protein
MTKGFSRRPGLPVIHECAAGIDIGARFHVVAVPPDISEEPVQTFRAFTADLHRMADWLVKVGVTTVAMASALRTYLRLRERRLDYAAAHIQHLQKALTYMNLQLHHVVSDITGATGMKIIRAIIGGERKPEILAAMRDVRCQASLETVRLSAGRELPARARLRADAGACAVRCLSGASQRLRRQRSSALWRRCAVKKPSRPIPCRRHGIVLVSPMDSISMYGRRCTS